MHDDNFFGTWLRDDTESKAQELEDINTKVDKMRQRVATRRLKEAAKGSKSVERVCLPEKLCEESGGADVVPQAVGCGR